MGFKNHFVHTKVGKCKIILHKIIFFNVLIAMCIFLDYSIGVVTQMTGLPR